MEKGIFSIPSEKYVSFANFKMCGKKMNYLEYCVIAGVSSKKQSKHA
jgi:hypothetical protein